MRFARFKRSELRTSAGSEAHKNPEPKAWIGWDMHMGEEMEEMPCDSRPSPW